MSRDFVEMLLALSEAGADFVVGGAHALAAHGRPRATGDLDLLVRPTPANAARVWNALRAFGATLFQIGVPPVRIDLLTSVDGVSFEEAWNGRITVEIDSRPVPVLGRAELVKNKRAVGRPQDLADLAWLEGRSGSPEDPAG